jgi:hypothetical protein
MPAEVKDAASRAGVQWNEYHNLDDCIAKSDVLYATRVQKERFESEAEYEAVKDMFIINNDVLAKAKESAIVMHPLPRVNEIDPEVDFDSRRAAYFRQMRYGLFVSCFFANAAMRIRCRAIECKADETDPHGLAHPRAGRINALTKGCQIVFSHHHSFLSIAILLQLPDDTIVISHRFCFINMHGFLDHTGPLWTCSFTSMCERCGVDPAEGAADTVQGVGLDMRIVKLAFLAPNQQYEYEYVYMHKFRPTIIYRCRWTSQAGDMYTSNCA